ncbi:hypothetical protein MLD52_09515 [Puniceicoccaceae bacterium K14]|nr:hypothetical protein [Puniceicoccaceae bacterium K14]
MVTEGGTGRSAKIPNWAWWVLASIICFWVCTPVIVNHLLPNFYTGGESGEFGDLFGSVNTFFSGVAMWGVIISLYLQRRELNQNAVEMEKSTNALSEQVEIGRLAAQMNALPALIEDLQASIKKNEYVDEKWAFNSADNVRQLMPLISKSHNSCIQQKEREIRALEAEKKNAPKSRRIDEEISRLNCEKNIVHDSVDTCMEYAKRLEELYIDRGRLYDQLEGVSTQKN